MENNRMAGAVPRGQPAAAARQERADHLNGTMHRNLIRAL
jgi:hypothetical protein